jgi:hypothetical protein
VILTVHKAIRWGKKDSFVVEDIDDATPDDLLLGLSLEADTTIPSLVNNQDNTEANKIETFQIEDGEENAP